MSTRKKEKQQMSKAKVWQESKGSVTNYKLQFQNCKHSADSQEWQMFQTLTRTQLMIIKQIPCESQFHFTDWIEFLPPKQQDQPSKNLYHALAALSLSASKFLPRKLWVSAEVIHSQFACSSKKETSTKFVQKWEKHN